MAQKISDLPAVATPALTDQFETNQGGVSKMETGEQIASLVAQIVLGGLNIGNNISLSQFGDASFNGIVTLGPGPQFQFFLDGSGLQTTEPILVNGTTVINNDGSVSFASGLFTVSPAGQFNIGGQNFQVDSDGTVSVGTGGSVNVTITPQGDVKIKDAGRGVVLVDRGDASNRRIVCTNGVLTTEAA